MRSLLRGVLGRREPPTTRDPSPAEEPQAQQSSYGALWRPQTMNEAMDLVLNQTDPDVFDAAGRADAETLRPLISPTDTVLDLGCGIGRVALHVAPMCRTLWAVDASQTMLDFAAARLGAVPNVRFALSEGTAIPSVESESIDVAYSILTLQHVEREDAFLLLRELSRVVRQGGTAFVTFPNLLSDRYLEGLIVYAERGEIANPARARFYTPEEVARVVPAAGFEIESLEAGDEIRAICRRP